MCLGCTKCNCSAAGTWQCEQVQNCKNNDLEKLQSLDEMDIQDAFSNMKDELYKMHYEKQNQLKYKNVPEPDTPEPDILDNYKPARHMFGETFDQMMSRLKRSVKNEMIKVNASVENTAPIKFHNTIDEINEDTLKSHNISGTLKANKVEINPMASRRTVSVNSSSNALLIEHTASMFNPHATDNKIDTSVIHDDKEDLLVHHKIFEIVGNQSLATKDKDLSKLLVNEMKAGEETIGSKDVKPISNITFTADNDTLTAVTFIAGHLLNKLWNMERDTSENSMDSEDMKHKTINNLLDLFKEPLNIRKESFLKHALEEISTAMENTDISNLSLCENIEKLKKEAIQNKSATKNQNSNKQTINQTSTVADALSKINNAFDLIKKYERIQNSLLDLKSRTDARKKELGVKLNVESLSEREQNTLDSFGSILGNITKLIMPNKNNKKFTKKLNDKNLFSDNYNIKKIVKDCNSRDLNISLKDKIILEYLKHIQNNPGCLLNSNDEVPPIPKIEGNILLNLSEIFKIKSMSDLLKLMRTSTQPSLRINTVKATTEMLSTVDVTEKSTSATLPDVKTTKGDKEDQFKITKEKLKSHLKTILEDLVELQNIKGKANPKGIQISDALPCIYNLLNTNNEGSLGDKNLTKIDVSRKTLAPPSIKTISETFDKLLKELKYTPHTRRTNMGSSNSPRPKSAIVWERIVKNKKNNIKTRRSMDGDIEISLRELKNEMDSVETLGSNTYKSIAYLMEVPAAERLILLKTLAIDTNRYIAILRDLIKYFGNVTKLSPVMYNSIDEFVDNVDMNINLNEKVIKNLDTPKNKQVRFKKVSSHKPVAVKPQRWRNRNTVKLSRDQLVNQLIKNRIKHYLRMKEAAIDGKFDDFNYELARKILFYLDLGDNNLAKDLFKILISPNKQESVVTFGSQALDPETYKSLSKQNEGRIMNKAPLIEFEEQKLSKKETPWSNQDQLIKQLLTIQNMNA